MEPDPSTVIELDGGWTLRPWHRDDGAVALAIFQDPDVARWDYLLPMRDFAQAHAWIDGRRAGWSDGSRASWAITDPSDDVVGSLALSHLDLARAPFPLVHPTVSYHLLPAGRGHGVATRAAVAASQWLLEAHGMHRVELHHDVANAASCAVARRAGFEWEGTRRRAQRVADGWVDEHLHARVTG